MDTKKSGIKINEIKKEWTEINNRSSNLDERIDETKSSYYYHFGLYHLLVLVWKREKIYQ